MFQSRCRHTYALLSVLCPVTQSDSLLQSVPPAFVTRYNRHCVSDELPRPSASHITEANVVCRLTDISLFNPGRFIEFFIWFVQLVTVCSLCVLVPSVLQRLLSLISHYFILLCISIVFYLRLYFLQYTLNS
jgi:hypothetical protein